LQEVERQALDLSKPERAQLAARILESLEDSDFAPEIEAAWETEIATRMAKMERGETKLHRWEDVKARLLLSR